MAEWVGYAGMILGVVIALLGAARFGYSLAQQRAACDLARLRRRLMPEAMTDVEALRWLASTVEAEAMAWPMKWEEHQQAAYTAVRQARDLAARIESVAPAWEQTPIRRE